MIRLLLAAIAVFVVTATQADDAWKTIPNEREMPAAIGSGHAKVNGIDMYYAIYGNAEGIPVLLIHGGLGHADLWAAQVADLSKDHTVVVTDTRGHGRSTNDGSAFTYDLLASDYLALLDVLKIDKVHLVGWSDGANIGYAISKTAPERLASHFAHAGNVTLAGVDPTVNDNAVFGQYVGMMAEDYRRLSPTPEKFDAFLGGLAAMWGSEKPGGMDALTTITVPTLVVQSAHDEAILTEHARAIAKRIPGAHLRILEDVSHFAILQDPDGYTAAIRAFLDR